jgi:hypothetical protein
MLNDLGDITGVQKWCEAEEITRRQDVSGIS